MKRRLNEDYYFWCCDWCDTENLVLWAGLQEGPSCGACHRPMPLSHMTVASAGEATPAGWH